MSMDATTQPVKANYWHEQLALYMIMNPTATNQETAQHFKVSPQYICILKNSDSFKAYYRSRMDKVFDKVVDDIYGQTIAMTSMALEKINHKLATIGDAMNPQELLQFADTGLKRLGYGANKFTPQVNITNTVQTAVVDRSDLESARRRMAETYGVEVSGHREPLAVESRQDSPLATIEVTPVSSPEPASQASAPLRIKVPSAPSPSRQATAGNHASSALLPAKDPE